ncbi:PREDICTED: uncharacterized protein LOC105463035 isoform X1 [Wasmannia auropunctata]|uniref:uncharacterized protein LOC105463035 isoform X1 n=1 Tax=Wasmannia auropunctata TaxID=64793 RepID=UPI0005ED82F8|nr:PREDICTED: uncharacterized protein LOC105463035 isoform X1 [Wasmannia auropunctata]
MSCCIVVGCKNRSVKKNYKQEMEEAKNKKFSFHLLPQNIERKIKWLEAINLKNYIPRKTAAVCSAHFREDNYEQNYSIRKLKKDAVPYLLEEQSENQERIQNQETKRVKKSIEHHTADSASSVAIAEIEPLPSHTAGSSSATTEIEPSPSHTAGSSSATTEIEFSPSHIAGSSSATTEIEFLPSHIAGSSFATAEIESSPSHIADISNERNEDRTEMMISSTIVQDCSSISNTMIDPSTRAPNIMVDRSTSVSPDRIVNSPTKTRIREFYTHETKILKRKLAASDFDKKKLQHKLKSLKSLLKELRTKNLITAEDSDILQHLDADMQEVIKRDIRKQQKLPVRRIYKANLRQFALSLHYYSPKAYNYVCKKFHNNLTIHTFIRNLCL